MKNWRRIIERHMRLAVSVSIAAGLCLTTAYAGKDEKKDEPPEWPEKLKKYERTGEFKDCLHLTQIRESRIIDDYHILFDATGDTAYVNQLPHRCHSLGGPGRAFSYETSLSKLCSLDIIHVIDSSASMTLGSCGLGKFEKVIEKEVTEPDVENEMSEDKGS